MADISDKIYLCQLQMKEKLKFKCLVGYRLLDTRLPFSSYFVVAILLQGFIKKTVNSS